MKKTLVSVSAVMMAVMLSAAPRSLNEAQLSANKFLTSDAPQALRMATGTPSLKLAHTALQDNKLPAFYIFNNGDDKGFVIVSADDNAREILGYSETGSFNADNMPENMKVWFQHYAEEIAWAAKNGHKYSLTAARRSVTPVSPLMKTKWDQGSPYNDKCPKDQTDNKRSYTGCVATAAAQIMKYYNHPTQGTGSHTDNWDNSVYGGSGHGQETANFGNTTYDWANMKNSYSGNESSTQKNAVATLMYHVGIACDMCYGSDQVGGSGAMTADMAKGLFTYFKYDKSMQFIRMDILGLSKFEAALLAEIEANRPVLIGGATKLNEGHEFVCDGVNAQGLFHINWGWGGSSDDYFVLSALDPEEQGAGGASSKAGFNVEVEAVIGIKPDEGGALSNPIMDIESYEGAYDYTFSKLEASKTENITFSTDLVYNYGPTDVPKNTPLVFAVYTQDTTLVQVFGSSKLSSKIEAGGEDYHSLSLSANFSGLAAGEYLMAIAFRLRDDLDWSPILVLDGGVYFPLHVTDSRVQITPLELHFKSGFGPKAEGNLDINNILLAYNGGSTPWELAMTNGYTQDYEPYLVVNFKGVSKTKIAGTYNVGTNATLYPSYEDYYYSQATTTSKSGTLLITCRGEEVYEVDLSFKGKNNKDYTVHGTFYGVIGLDYSDYYWSGVSLIVLTDEYEIPSAIETVVADKSEAIKTIENGQIVIKIGDKTYNILGQIQ